MFTLIVDHECDILRVRCIDFKEVIKTYKDINKKYRHIKLVGIMNQDYLESEKLKIKFEHVR